MTRRATTGLRLQILAALGLPGASLASCSSPGPATTGRTEVPSEGEAIVVTVPETEGSTALRPVETGTESSPKPSLFAGCGEDRYRAMVCRQRGADEACPESSESRYSELDLPEPLGGFEELERDAMLERRYATFLAGTESDAAMEACCFSACVAVELAPEGDSIPARYRAGVRCIGELDAMSGPGATERCPAAVRIPGGPVRNFAAAYDEAVTEQRRQEFKRTAGFEDLSVCCYEAPVRPPRIRRGRVLRDDSDEVTSAPTTGSIWHADPGVLSLEGLSDEDRLWATRVWLEAAACEHASVAAFGKLTLQLMEFGAPPDLLAACQCAAIDEIEHARLSYAIASRYAGEALDPGALPVPRLQPTSLAELFEETFVDGCVGESVAAALAAESAERARELTAIFRRIAEDEARHAVLGWRICAWALRLEPSLKDGLRRLVAACEQELSTQAVASDEVVGPELRAQGQLNPREEQMVRRGVLELVVIPCGRALLDSAQPCGERARAGRRVEGIGEGAWVTSRDRAES